jgi:hypothetical protein
MPAKTVNKLGDKLVKIGESFTVSLYDNGFMLAADGRNKKGDYVNARILCNNVDDLVTLVREASEMERE